MGCMSVDVLTICIAFIKKSHRFQGVHCGVVGSILARKARGPWFNFRWWQTDFCVTLISVYIYPAP